MERLTKIDWSKPMLRRDPGRQRCLDPGKLGADRVRHRDDVRLGLTDHADRDRLDALEAQGAPLVFRSQLHPAQVLELDQNAAGVADHQIAELLRGLELTQRADGEFPALRFDAARGDLDVAAPNGLLDVLHRQAAGGKLGGGQPDPHREAPLTEDPGLAHAGQRLQPALDQPVADVGELEQVVVLAGQGQPEERLRVGILLRHHRLFDVLRQALPDSGDLVSGVLRRRLDAPLQVELQGDVADTFPAGARKGAESLDRAQLLLQDVGHRRLDHLGIGSRQYGGDRHDRGVDIGELAHGELGVSNDAEEHQRQAEHAGQHRPPNRHIRNFHDGTLPGSDRGGPVPPNLRRANTIKSNEWPRNRLAARSPQRRPAMALVRDHICRLKRARTCTLRGGAGGDSFAPGPAHVLDSPVSRSRGLMAPKLSSRQQAQLAYLSCCLRSSSAFTA